MTWLWRVSRVCSCWIRTDLKSESTRPCVLSMIANGRVWALDMPPLQNGPFLALVSSLMPCYVHPQTACFSVLALLFHRLTAYLLVGWWKILLRAEPGLPITFAWSLLVIYRTYSWYRSTLRFPFGFFLISH